MRKTRLFLAENRYFLKNGAAGLYPHESNVISILKPRKPFFFGQFERGVRV